MAFRRRCCLNVFLLLLFTILAPITVSAQNSIYVWPHFTNYISFLDSTKAITASLLDKKIQKQYRAIIDEKNKSINEKYNEKGYLFDDLAYPYLHSIFDYILEKNHLNKNHFHFFIDRTAVVNAYSYEDGTVVCNLGLVTTMENESQLAMVICHELGHCLLHHVNTAITKQLNTFNSPAFAARIKAIKKDEYNQKEKLEGLMLDNIYDQRRHDRSQEKAADSLAMILFSNTDYNGQNVAHIFDLLDSADTKANTINVNQFFKREGITIFEGLTSPQKLMSFGEQPRREILDSLKTHPDCSQRKIWMQSFFNKTHQSGKDYLLANSSIFNAVKKTAYFNGALYSKDQGCLSLYLFQLIQTDERYPNDTFIHTEIFNTIANLSKHMKEHTLHLVVDYNYNTNDENDQYAILIKMLDNLSSTEMADAATKYYNNNKSLINNANETFNTINNKN